MDLDVYGLCLGGNVFGWTADRDASFAVLDAYVEAGGNFIDTADTYMRPNMGISETIIGEWMAARGNRDELVIATKVGSDGGLSAANIAAHVDESLARLQTDRIDLYYAHKDDGSVPVEETVRAFDRWCATGKVRYVAASNAPRERLRRVAGDRRSARASPRTCGCSRTTTSSSARATSASTRRSSRAYGLAVAPYYALASGFLTGKYRDASANGGSPARRDGARGTSTSAAGACWTRWTRSPPRTASRSPRSPSPGWPPSPGSSRRSPARALPSSSPASCPAVGLELTADEMARLDEASR